MKRQTKFECVNCRSTFTQDLEHSEQVGNCPTCSSSDLIIRSEFGRNANYIIKYDGNPLIMPKKYICNNCNNEFTINCRNLVRLGDRKCSCGSYNTTRVVEAKNRTFALLGLKDWTEGKTSQEIADCLVPDENGKFKDPY